jgi:antigen flippase
LNSIGSDRPEPQPDGASPRSGLVSASAVTLVASAAGFIAGVLRAKLLAVLFGTVGVGILANLAIYTNLVAQVGSLLAGQGLTRAVAAERAADRADRVDWLIRYSIIATGAAGLVIAAGTVVLSGQLADLLTGSPSFAGLVAITALAVPATLVAYAYGQVLQGYVRIGSIAKVQLATSILSLVVVAILATVVGVVGAVLAVVATSVIQLGLLYRREPWVLTGRSWRALGMSLEQLRPLLAVGVASVLLGGASTLVVLLIRAAIVQQLGIEAAGVYQPVAAVSDTYLEIILASTSVYLLPRIAELVSSRRIREAGKEVGRGLRLTLTITVPLIIVGLGFSESVVAILYSDAFGGSADPLAIQMVGNTFKVIAWSVGVALIPLGMYRTWLAIGVSTVAAKYGLTMVLLPMLQLKGVAIAYSLAWMWCTVISLVAVVLVAGLRLPKEYWSIAIAGAIGVSAVLVARAISPFAAGWVGIIALIVFLIIVRDDLVELANEFREIAARQGRLRMWGGS